ncbi:MAG: symmetrical bis(5'-nucleosyl)-tetraphosphatase [Chromatiales bacterium]|nr:symmetrical bis(5'-nucleosyl)-tetraphosphatase [Chromatiales bacterium]
MAIWAIGDVQGCDEQLGKLLDRLNPTPGRDEIWFVGDLVNRGPDSLGVLRRVRQLGDMAVCVLGNHDLHLLALAFGNGSRARNRHLTQVLDAPDADVLIEWLRHRPLAHYRPDLGTLLVHAGLPPQWHPLQTIRLAREAEDVLRGPGCGAFLQQLYGDLPDLWDPTLAGHDRLRFIVNALTRIRYCHPDGRLELRRKGRPGSQPDHLVPWFEAPGRASSNVRIVFGHWSSLGLMQAARLLALDTGCIWGGELTAARLDGPARICAVDCRPGSPLADHDDPLSHAPG